ncbi:MAG TPA: methyl-accepting chemotaxis protein [Methanospirillum sp.]|uniref:methyl-accepting chemotaxis protein n=1 Tax=Methanospirillum sp. TaxID=45200 RepID=UPI002CEE498D|nr:methyl-accepting chemotaxis protein [Methanospirillum sp.]HWQ63926.1 methyl-accepting chemotaxis protein [Methanospirillum sp.]
MGAEPLDVVNSFDSPPVLALIDNIPCPVLIMKDNHFCGCNQIAGKLFKSLDKSFIIGKDLLGISPLKQPDGSDSANHVGSLLSRVTPGKILNIEWRFSRSDNTTFDGKGTIRQTDPAYGDFLIFSFIDNSAESRAIRDILNISEEMKKGNLRTRISSEGYHGDLETLINRINEMLDDILYPFRDMSKILVKISNGNIHSRIDQTYQGEHERIRTAVNSVADVIIELQNEILRITKSAQNGTITERGDPNKFLGAYAEVITEINDMLDTIINPVMQGYRVLKKIKGGDLSDRMEIECVGDHAKLKNAINNVHDWLTELIVYVTRISEGDLTASIKKASDQDQIYEPLMKMRDNIRSLIDDVNALGKAGTDGKLSVRADPMRHKGEFRTIIEGMNKTLDSVIIPVNEAMVVSETYANYNFARRINPGLSMHGDWADFKTALDQVGANVSQAVSIINEQVISLNSVVTQTHGSINDVSQGTNALADIAQAVSLNAERGKDGISQILKAMEDLAINVTDVSARADEVNHLATDTSHLSTKGTDLAKGAETGMEEITHSTDQVVQIVHEIMDEMKTISKITKVISDIASQTNLLALNAAIEAARAGEAGRGFAVVASEVKSLALESRQSAENITGMIDSLQKKTELASSTMDQSAVSVQSGGKALSETLKVFNEIIGSISTISERMDQVARSAEQQAAVVEEITASINEVNEMVMNTSKEAVSAAAASQQAAAATDQLTDQSEQVFSVATRLNNEMQKFTVS